MKDHEYFVYIMSSRLTLVCLFPGRFVDVAMLRATRRRQRLRELRARPRKDFPKSAAAWETSGESSRAENVVDLAAHVLMRDAPSGIQGRNAFLHLVTEPLVMTDVVGDQFLHDLVRAPAGLGCNAGEFGFEIGRRGNFACFILDGRRIDLQWKKPDRVVWSW